MELQQRDIVVGDIASISFNGSTASDYVIISITPFQIKTSTYNIIKSVGEWKIAGINVPHTIDFKNGVLYSKDILFEIASHLSSQDLLNLCLSGVKMSELCYDEKQWMDRALRDYGEIIYKPVSMTYREYYIAKSITMNKVAELGRVDLVHILKSFGFRITVKALFQAVEYGHVSFVNKFISELTDVERFTLDDMLVVRAVKLGDIQYLRTEKSRFILNDKKRSYYVGEYNLSDTLLTVCSRLAVIYNHLDIVQYLTNLDYKYGTLALINSMQYGNVNITNWLKRQHLLYQENDLTEALKTGKLDIIKTIFNFHVFRAYSNDNSSFGTDNSRMLAITRNLQHNSKKIEEIIYLHCDSETIMWLIMHNYLSQIDIMSRFKADSAAGQSTPIMLEWAHKEGYLITSNAYIYAVQNNRMINLDWLAEYGIEMSQPVLLSCVEIAKIEHLEWLSSHFPEYMVHNPSGIYTENFDSAKWLYEHGFGVSIDTILVIAHLTHANVRRNMLNYFEGFIVSVSKDTSIMDDLGYILRKDPDIEGLDWIKSHGGEIHKDSILMPLHRSIIDIEVMEWIYQHLDNKPKTIQEMDSYINAINDYQRAGIYRSYKSKDPLGKNIHPAVAEWLSYHGIV
jgi:uncharacterized protein YlbG (UPF0298 family)